MHFREEEKQAENRLRLFLKTAIELSVYIYIKKVAEKEALLRRGDAICRKKHIRSVGQIAMLNKNNTTFGLTVYFDGYYILIAAYILKW